MNTLWSARNSRERFLIVLCLLVVAIGIPLLLFQGGGDNKKLLPRAEARQKYQKAAQQINATRLETDMLKADLQRLTFRESPEDVVPRVIRALQEQAKAAGLHLREIKPLRAR